MTLRPEEPIERSVEVLALILFGVLGLSHILRPRAWLEFFILLQGKGEAGVFVDGFLNLPLAGIIITLHNVWSGIPVVLTLIKSLLRFCLPKQGLIMMAQLSMARPGRSGWLVPGFWSLPASLAMRSTAGQLQ